MLFESCMDFVPLSPDVLAGSALQLSLCGCAAGRAAGRDNFLDKAGLRGQAAGRPTAEHRMTAPRDEQALMSAYAAGDASALEPLFRALAPRLMGFYKRAGLSHEQSEDLVQATFVRLHQSRDRYREGAPLRPWLFTIAARVRLDYLRKQRRSPTASDTDVDTLQDPVEFAPPELEQRVNTVRDALDALPPGLRVVVHLHRFEELSFSEIGAVLNINEGAARVRAFRAYKMLRERLRPLVAEEK
jgi:RNA polymerase sigma factor (sigma-70 family)